MLIEFICEYLMTILVLVMLVAFGHNSVLSNGDVLFFASVCLPVAKTWPRSRRSSYLITFKSSIF